MDSSSPLDRAAKVMGTQAALAEKLGVTAQAVTNWRRNGVPAERVLDIERVTGVPRHELRPDIYPPDEYRAA